MQRTRAWTLAALLGAAGAAADPPNGAISGRVIAAETGAPIEGATIVLTSHRDGLVHGRARTDADGRFTAYDLPFGPYDVTASARGRQDDAAGPGGWPGDPVFVESGGHARGVELVLERAAAITVHAQDAGGRPIAASLSFQRKGTTNRSWFSQSKTDGRSFVDRLPPGDYVVSGHRLRDGGVGAEGARRFWPDAADAASAKLVTLALDAPQEITFTFPGAEGASAPPDASASPAAIGGAPATLRVRVMGRDGASVAAAVVFASVAEEAQPRLLREVARCRTDETGACVLEGLAPRETWISVAGPDGYADWSSPRATAEPGRLRTHRRVVPRPGAREELLLALAREAELRVRFVTEAGEVLAGSGHVVLVDDRPIRQRTADDEILVRGLRPGAGVRLAFEREPESGWTIVELRGTDVVLRAEDRSVTIASADRPGRVDAIVAPAVTLTGRTSCDGMVIAERVEPATDGSGAWRRAGAGNESRDEDGRPIVVARPVDGSYVLDGLAPGTYELRCEGSSRWRTSVEIAAGEPGRVMALDLPAGAD